MHSDRERDDRIEAQPAGHEHERHAHTEERDEVKKVAKQLLERLKALLVLDWRKRQSSRARVEDAIKGLLDADLPRTYTPELYQQKCSTLFEHFYESYPESGTGAYAMVE